MVAEREPYTKGLRKNQTGMALLVTLSVTAALIAVALEAHRSVRTSVYATAMGRDRVTLEAMVTSGIHGAMALLAADTQDPEADSFLDDWANPRIQEYLISAMPFETGAITFSIQDERSRIQVNALVDFPSGRQFKPKQQILLTNLLSVLMGPSIDTDTPASGIVDAIKDWLDSNDGNAVTGIYGAEKGYYETLTPPYSCRNGAMVHLQELLRVRGVTPDLMVGTRDQPGLEKYLTVHGMQATQGTGFDFDGKININTASAAVIAAMLPESQRDLAQSIIDFRGEVEAKETPEVLADALWYRQAPGCGDLNLSKKRYTLTSDLFRIRSEAKINDARLAVSAVVQRQSNKSGKTECRILTWEVL